MKRIANALLAGLVSILLISCGNETENAIKDSSLSDYTDMNYQEIENEEDKVFLNEEKLDESEMDVEESSESIEESEIIEKTELESLDESTQESENEPELENTEVSDTNQKENTNVEDTTSFMKVWKSATGSKYHSINNCGKMNPDKAKEMTKQEAEALGLERCSKCW